jgi:hypothetical protein
MRNGFVSRHQHAAGEGFRGMNNLFAHIEILTCGAQVPVREDSLPHHTSVQMRRNT